MYKNFATIQWADAGISPYIYCGNTTGRSVAVSCCFYISQILYATAFYYHIKTVDFLPVVWYTHLYDKVSIEEHSSIVTFGKTVKAER